MTAAVAAVAAAAGLAVTPAKATSSFGVTRIAGSDRFQTADKVDQAAFPGGVTNGVALLADGIPGHQTDALAAAGVEGVNSVGVIITDNSNSVPPNTMAALKNNNVKTIVVVGGPAAVSSAQVKQLNNAGYPNCQAPSVTKGCIDSTTYAGATRFSTMQLLDDSIAPASVGTDAAGNPTAILASGDDHHFVDALSAGGLSYAKHFPIILTNSTSASLQPEAQQVITQLGIKDLIVVGGAAAIPTSQYNPPPSGVTTVTDYGGKDRSQTSLDLADFAISSGWLKKTSMSVARGDDGSDALAGAAFSGVSGIPTLVTNSPTDVGSVPAFGQEHSDTLAGPSYAYGGTSAIPDSQLAAISVAAGSCNTAPAGTITPGGNVTIDNSCAFVEGGYAYQYGPGDTYQLASAPIPGSPPQCSADSGGYADFQSRLSLGDQVTGTYAPGGTSTFCLNDQAPPPPGNAAAAGNTAGGGVSVTWTPPSGASTYGITGYQVWRAPASTNNAPSPQFYTCPAVNSGTGSPQTPPASPYVSVATVGATTTSYNDTTAANPNYYCYAVSSVAPNAKGGTAPAAAAPASPSQPNPMAGTPTQAAQATAGAVPKMTGITVTGQTIVVQYNEPINPATVDPGSASCQDKVAPPPGGTCMTGYAESGSDFQVTAVTSNATSSNSYTGTWLAWASGTQVFIDVSKPFTGMSQVTVTSRSTGADGNTICASGTSGTSCVSEPIGDSASAAPSPAAGSAPTIINISAVASSQPQTITLTFSSPIDCVTLDTGQFTVKADASQPAAGSPNSVSCQTGGSTGTDTKVVLSQFQPIFPTHQAQVIYTANGAGQRIITSVAPNSGQAVPDQTLTVTPT